MEPTSDEIGTLVHAQLASIRDPLVRQGLEQILVPPQPHFRNWDYGAPGERFLCWTIAVHDASDTSMVYSEHGFGPRCPWGLVLTKELWFGMDSGWFLNLRDCFVESFAAGELSIWQVVRNECSIGEDVLHRNLAFSEAYRLRDSLARQHNDAKFHVLPRPDDVWV